MAAMLQRLAPRLAPCRRSAARCFSSSSSGSSPSSGSSSSSGSPSPPDAAGSTTHFGFQQVREEDKQPMVASVFHKVAERYDVMNDFMSGGMHRVWKDSFVDTLHPVGPLRVLDVAGGTGDIAFRIAERLSTGRNAASAQDSEIVICDINSSMLQVGRERAEKQLPPARAAMFQWVEGNAEQLAFPDNSFDVYTIAFGIRNVTHVDRALAEAFRVLRPGGRFLCMEFSQVPNPLIRAVYDAYSFNMIPFMGEKVADDRASYQYLVESIRQFPPQEQFKAMIQDAGFSRVSYDNYTLGVVAVHSGFKL